MKHGRIMFFAAIMAVLVATMLLLSMFRKDENRRRSLAGLIRLQGCIFVYEREHGYLPSTIREAVVGTKYERIKVEWGSKMEICVSNYDGRGGWIYDPSRRIVGINRKGWEQNTLTIPNQNGSGVGKEK